MSNKVLAIDDSETMHRLYNMIFSDTEYELILSDNGEDGLEKLKEKKPGIILLDFIMPRLNGYHFCKIIREEMDMDIPILLITSKAEDVGNKFIQKFRNIDYIPKPFQPEDILDKMERMLGSQDEIAEEKPTTPNETESGGKVHNIDDHLIKDTSALEDNIFEALKHRMGSFIKKRLRVEMGYTDAEIKGELDRIDDLLTNTPDTAGIFTVFDNERVFKIYTKDKKIYFAWDEDAGLDWFYEILQNVTGVCLLKGDKPSDLKEQFMLMEMDMSMVKSAFNFYLFDLMDSINELTDGRYFFSGGDISGYTLGDVYLTAGELEKGYYEYKEEKLEISKIIYDNTLFPTMTGEINNNFTTMETKVAELCNAGKSVGEIKKLFGYNRQLALNTLGALVLTGYTKLQEVGNDKNSAG